MNKKGQSILSEYTMIFFVVIAALVAITTYVQRGFEARIHDAKNFAITQANAACDANCQIATGNVAYEYEPYYVQMFSNVQHNENEVIGLTNGSAGETGSIYLNGTYDQSGVISNSTQLPAHCANGGC